MPPSEHNAKQIDKQDNQQNTNSDPTITSSMPPSPTTPVAPAQTHRWLWGLVALLALTTLLAGSMLWRQLHQTPKVETMTREGVISKIQTLNRLQTVAYHVDTVITAQKQGNWYALWQDEQKGLFVAHGRVQAGIDLSQLTADNVTIASTPTPQTATSQSPNGAAALQPQITITLPPAQVFETYLDNVEVYDIKTGMFGIVNVDPQIFAQAQTAGKAQVLATACKSEMLTLATDNAQKQIQALFALTKLDVKVIASAPKACG